MSPAIYSMISLRVCGKIGLYWEFAVNTFKKTHWGHCGYIGGYFVKETSMSGSGPCWPHWGWNCERTQGFLSKSGSGVLWWLLLQCIPHVPPGYFVIPSVATFWKRSQCNPWGKVWLNWGALSKSNQHVPPGESVNKLFKKTQCNQHVSPG
jgi:hypothetical protein